MRISLNNAHELTFANVQVLIREGNDSVNSQFCVTKDGYFFLCEDVRNLNHSELLFRLEQNDAGNNYVGEEAAGDELWVNTIFNIIKANWPKPVDSYIDDYSPYL